MKDPVNLKLSHPKHVHESELAVRFWVSRSLPCLVFEGGLGDLKLCTIFVERVHVGHRTP